MAVTIPLTNFVHSVGMTASIHELSIQPHPGRSRGRARATKPLTRRSRSCWFGHTQGLLGSKGRPRPELL